MKRFFSFICVVALLATGCSDSFVASPNPAPRGTASQILFTTLPTSILSFPFTAISSSDANGRQRADIVHQPAYLACAPQAGKMLYLVLQSIDGNEVVILKIADIRSTHNSIDTDTFSVNSIAIDTFSVEGITRLKEVALSPDGQAVAYAILSGGSGGASINRLRHFNVQRKKRVEIDSFFAPDFAPGVASFISQVSFSPDGQYLAVATWGKSERLRVYNLQGWGGETAIQPKKVAWNTGPYIAWLPDSRTIVYAEGRSPTVSYLSCMQENSYRYIYFLPDSSRVCTVDIHGAIKVCFDWDVAIGEIACSPNGQKLLYCRLIPDNDGGGGDCHFSDITVRDIDDATGSAARVIGGAQKGARYSNPQWLPDGLSVSFTEYTVVFSFPWIINSSIRIVAFDPSKADVVILNAFNGYWLP